MVNNERNYFSIKGGFLFLIVILFILGCFHKEELKKDQVRVVEDRKRVPLIHPIINLEVIEISGTGTVIVKKGKVLIRKGKREPLLEIKLGNKVEFEDIIKTEERAEVEIDFGDKKVIKITENREIYFKKSE